MKKAILIVFVLLAVAFVVIQFIRPDFNNPPVVEAEKLEMNAEVPPEVAKILRTSCMDCHSNETAYPWYSKIQPSAWFLADHITEGRRELNLSVWGTYEARRKRKKLEKICTEAQHGEMPLWSYTIIHRDAVLSETQIKMLCDWTASEIAKLGESPS